MEVPVGIEGEAEAELVGAVGCLQVSWVSEDPAQTDGYN